MNRNFYTFDWPTVSFFIEKESFIDSILPQEFRYAVTQAPRETFWDKVKSLFK